MTDSPSTFLRHFDCPALPDCPVGVGHGILLRFGLIRNESFYLAALQLATSLLKAGQAGRALLLLDRAMSVKLADPLQPWPIPYAAVAWILNGATGEEFGGNPRIHYQHLATRVRGSELRVWRAWACWALVRKLRPEFSGDQKDDSLKPTLEQIAQGLNQRAGAVELGLWQKVMDKSEDE